MAGTNPYPYPWIPIPTTHVGYPYPCLSLEAITIDTRTAQQIQFCGKDYSPIYEEYFLALSKVMASESMLQTAFSA